MLGCHHEGIEVHLTNLEAEAIEDAKGSRDQWNTFHPCSLGHLRLVLGGHRRRHINIAWMARAPENEGWLRATGNIRKFHKADGWISARYLVRSFRPIGRWHGPGSVAYWW